MQGTLFLQPTLRHARLQGLRYGGFGCRDVTLVGPSSPHPMHQSSSPLTHTSLRYIALLSLLSTRPAFVPLTTHAGTSPGGFSVGARCTLPPPAC